MQMHVIYDGNSTPRGTILLDERPNNEKSALLVQIGAALRSNGWAIDTGTSLPQEPYQGHMSQERKAQMMAEYGLPPNQG